MDNLFIFSDEAGLHTGGRYFVVAGVACAKYRLWLKDNLEHIERVSGKEKKDWHATKNQVQRIRYIEQALRISRR